MSNARKQATINSALWSAYGDALGFITELADQRILRQRIQADKVTELNPWTRRIGGRFGVDIQLPFGCYSDDTQLRLATARAISELGEFDIEAFSKVELPVWMSYSLGAGRGTKLAASSLARKDTRWFSNFYVEESANYIASGGNGAAMRIQPHVWASKNIKDPLSYLLDVLRNSISTHGHPRAIAGAVFHALCLGRILETGTALSIGDLQEINLWTTKIPKLIAEDPYLHDFWISKWETLSREQLQTAFLSVHREIDKDIDFIYPLLKNIGQFRYGDFVKALRLNDPTSRGSGTRTSLAAAIISIFATKHTPNDLLLIAANTLGTDTDSIASMAGALIGTFLNQRPPQLPQDWQLIEQDSIRLYELSQGSLIKGFPYPSLLGWRPPKSAVDVVFSEEDRLIASGLGPIIPLSPATPANTSRGDHVYQWVQTKFQQCLLIKRRSDKALGLNHRPNFSSQNQLFQTKPLKSPDLSKQLTNNTNNNITTEPITPKTTKRDIDELSNEAIQSSFDPLTIGTHIIELSDSGEGIERVIAYTAIIAKARVSRLRRGSIEKDKPQN